MIRVVNFVCFTVCGLACLALYHVSDETRVAQGQVAAVNRQIAVEQQSVHVLQAEWDRLANPERVQKVSQAQNGIEDAPAVELSALTLLPRRGDSTPLEDAQLRTANALVPADDARAHVAASGD